MLTRTGILPNDQVDYISGETRIFAILGDPIAQVRSPEMVTAELVSRDQNAILIPLQISAEEFASIMPALKKLKNLDGMILTIPHKGTTMNHVDELGRQAQIVGSINAMARKPNGQWIGEIFDGIGCVTAHQRAGIDFKDKAVQIIGAGGAGSAIGIAVANAKPKSMHIVDPDTVRRASLAHKISSLSDQIRVSTGMAQPGRFDHILNASPVGMLSDNRNPLGSDEIPKTTTVFDAIVKPEETKLLKAARHCGCQTVTGREMMKGQIRSIVDFFITTLETTQ